MSKKNTVSSDVNIVKNDAVPQHPGIEHFLNLNTILHSLVDFIRPETYIAQDELQAYNERKDKFLRESTSKRNKQQQKGKGPTSTSSFDVAGVESIRTTSGIYRFLAHHDKNNSSTANNKKKSSTPVSREELLKKLHDKMPHRQQQAENGVEENGKRKRTKDKSAERTKRPRSTTKEWIAPSSNDNEESKPSTKTPPFVPNQITFGRFEFKTEDSVDTSSKKKKTKKFQNKKQQLISTLKKVESEQDEINRLKEENPEEGKEILRSKNWKTALAKAKGEKIRDNVQLLRKSIKKQSKLRERSAKKWQRNKSETNKRVKEKQEKRQTNLQKRKDDKKSKIKKRLIKKGRLIS
ncbi:unnamed protein product [Rotaria socialis]|uniref:Ribosomal RNA-processing protein 14/surfeit locus protein 6 C-terminal domain-containing protein n=1 Tax=Rotaria socialis TaxID=392032 RepID=A0A820S374_9BILA|nr:unnamed protein product [Rotaria socialis]CAF4446788.1 unnamed protein product [Rotaria socialis]